MRKPNFFIVGAPKCGTTSLYEYLREHPEVFMPDRKEPGFFCTDFYKPHRLNEEEYLSLFEDAGSAKRVGEASTWYLYSEKAREGIKASCPDARIIIMLRNPVDMIYSLHAQRLWNGREDIRDFEEALEAEEDRKKGKRLPPYAFSVQLLFYRDLARYQRFVRSYMEVFGKNQVHIIIFEEFIRQVGECYHEVCEFLEIDPGFKPSFEAHNPSKRLRSTRLRRVIRSPLINTVGRVLVPAGIRQNTKNAMLKANTKVERRAPMTTELRRGLEEELAPDTLELSRLLGRDLMKWWGGPLDRKQSVRRDKPIGGSQQKALTP